MISKRIRYNKNEVMRSRFLQLPWFLLEEEEFRDLSNDARILYALLKNRNELSIVNGWYDENDNVYQIFTRAEMAKILKLSIKTVVKAMKDLRKFKLIDEQRMGQGIPNRIYLLTLESLSGTKTCTFYNSRSVKNTSPEVQNLQPSNKDLNKTDIKKTEREKKDLREKIEVDIEKEKKETLSLNLKEKEEVKNISTDTKKIASGLSTDKTKFTMNAYDSNNHIINAEEKSIGCEKKFLSGEEKIAKETVKEPTEEKSVDIKKESKELKSVAKTIINELDNQVKTAKKREVKPATDEEIKQSETIVNELNKCIRKQSKKDIFLSNTQKSINAIVHWLREGFKINDFVSIINLKVKTWMGNPMAVQLKPSVLFSVNNFREYLEETKLEQLTNPIYKIKPEQDCQPTRTNCQTEGNKKDNDEIMRLAIEKHKKEIAERNKNLKPTPEQIEWCKKNFSGLLNRIGHSV